MRLVIFPDQLHRIVGRHGDVYGIASITPITLWSFRFNIVFECVQDLENSRIVLVLGSQGSELAVGPPAILVVRCFKLGSAPWAIWFLATEMIAGLTPLQELGDVVGSIRPRFHLCSAANNPDGCDHTGGATAAF